nr:MAG TPA: hypothetical protein [Caudoviricetes sp.]
MVCTDFVLGCVENSPSFQDYFIFYSCPYTSIGV